MADTDDIAPAAPENAVSVTKRKRGRPPVKYPVPGQERNTRYRHRQMLRDLCTYQALGMLIGTCVKADIELPLMATLAMKDKHLRHETINAMRQFIASNFDSHGLMDSTITWIENNFRPETDNNIY